MSLASLRVYGLYGRQRHLVFLPPARIRLLVASFSEELEVAVKVRNWFPGRLYPITMWMAVLTSVTLMPAVASAQSAIAGQVEDNSKAVLPGVTFEATSPAPTE